MRKYYIAFIIIVVLLSATIYWKLSNDNRSIDTSNQTLSAVEALSQEDDSNFKKALEPREFIFPDDHGPHDDYKIEWWYFTGNVESKDGREFGYQFTIFRNGLTTDSLEIQSDWASNQLYLAHFGLTDISKKQFYSYDKIFRELDGVAGANANPFYARVEDWVISAEYPDGDYEMPTFKIKAKADDVAIDFEISPNKKPIYHGERGLSQKSKTPGNASYYYSYTRMNTKGNIEIEGKTYNVDGSSWMDREWSTSALEANQSGWDWFSIQLNDTTEFMYFQLRGKDGNDKNFAKGTYIDKSGNSEYISLDEVKLEKLDFWKSPLGANYPIKWKLSIEKYNLVCTIESTVNNQEHNFDLRYYEGAVKVYDDSRNEIGRGYVEMTGY